MKKTKKIRLISLSQVVLMIMTLVVLAIPTMIFADEHNVNLGSASTFGILAGSAITNTGPTTVNGTAGGDIGLHPGDDPTLETFEGQSDVTLTGEIYLSDAKAEQANADLLTAYLVAEGKDSDFPIVDDLGGKTLLPGVYTSGSSIGITGTLTLDADGDPNAVFIFQAGSTLTTAADDSEIILINGAQPCNVFWQVGSSATLGTNTLFVGHILAMASITATTGAEVHGQLLAYEGAVTLESNVITNDACLTAGSLRVTKRVEGPVDDLTLVPFQITITGENYTDTQPIVDGGFYTWEGLADGLYTISESGLSQEWEVLGLGEYNVAFGEMTLVTVRNVYTAPAVITLGSLTVTKIVTGDVGDLELLPFEITLSGQGFTSMVKLADGESHTWQNLAFGTYTITENKTLLSSEWTVSGEGTVEITSDQTVLVTITNEFEEEVVVIVEPQIPDTGDNATLVLSGLFMLGFGLLILVKVKPSNK